MESLIARWRLSWQGSTVALSGAVAEREEMRLLVVAVRLWRFPPHLGGCSTVPAQLNNAIHEYYYGGAVALLLQDHLTMSVSRFAGYKTLSLIHI